MDLKQKRGVISVKLLFLGTGAAFTIGQGNYQSNMILESNQSNKLLLDCGTDIRFALHDQGLTYHDIDSLYISHIHADHIGGMEWLGFSRKFVGNDERPTLYLTNDLATQLWDNALSGGMRTLDGEIAHLDTYFNVHYLEDEQGYFEWEDGHLDLIKTFHVKNGNKYRPSYGIVLRYQSKKILISMDTQFVLEHFQPIYEQSDLIFHDCETSDRVSGVHATYQELLTLPPDIKAKMWLYDYNDGPLPDAIKDGFRGFVNKGQRFDFDDDDTF